MKLWKTMSSSGAVALGTLGFALIMTGCDRKQEITVTAPQGAPQQQPLPPQQVVAEQPAPQYIVVQQAPPPIIVEVQPAPPTPQHFWIAGSWHWDNQRYSWQAGRYELPPQAGAVWVSTRYEPDGHNFRYTRGEWRKPDDHGHDRDHH